MDTLSSCHWFFRLHARVRIVDLLSNVNITGTKKRSLFGSRDHQVASIPTLSTTELLSTDKTRNVISLFSILFHSACSGA